MMSTHPPDLEVKLQRFNSDGLLYIELGKGSYAFLKFKVKGSVLVVESVYTPEEFRGRGIATRLMDLIVEYAVSNGYKIDPRCSFAKHYFEKHSEKRATCLEPLEDLSSPPQ